MDVAVDATTTTITTSTAVTTTAVLTTTALGTGGGGDGRGEATLRRLSEQEAAMSFLDRLLGRATTPSTPTAATWPVTVLVPTGLDPMSSGTNKYMRGFFIRDASTDRSISHQQLSELVPGAVVFNVAGTSHRQDALQGPAFAPGEPVKLIPEPSNPYDRNAVGVWDTHRRKHIGYVPKDLAPTVGRIFKGREPFGATVFFEFLQGKRRMAVSVLLAPAAFLQTLTIEDEE